METQKHIKITEFNPEAFKEINKDLFFGNNKDKPVIKQITYQKFEAIAWDLMTILDAIEVIALNNHGADLSICGGLAGLAKKLVANDELCFLDRLLIKTDENKNDFVEIKK